MNASSSEPGRSVLGAQTATDRANDFVLGPEMLCVPVQSVASFDEALELINRKWYLAVINNYPKRRDLAVSLLSRFQGLMKDGKAEEAVSLLERHGIILDN